MIDEPAAASEASSGKSRKKQLPLWQECILLLGIALLLAIAAKSLFVQAFYIPSPSMEPQFVKNDRILVEKVSTWGDRQVHRGDIIVFKDPGNWLNEPAAPANPVTRMLEAVGLYPSGGHLVKRVIAVGGDHVVCCDKQGRMTVNGTPLFETSYLPKGTKPSSQEFDVHVPEDKLWVMGDNRDNSCDSRCHISETSGGFVDEDLVVGKVWALMWPPKRAEFIDHPDTFDKVPDAG